MRLRRRRWSGDGEVIAPSRVRFSTGVLLGASTAAVAMLALWSPTIVPYATELVPGVATRVDVPQSGSIRRGTTRELMLEPAERPITGKTMLEQAPGRARTRAAVEADSNQAEVDTRNGAIASRLDAESRQAEEGDPVPRVSPPAGGNDQEKVALAGQAARERSKWSSPRCCNRGRIPDRPGDPRQLALRFDEEHLRQV